MIGLKRLFECLNEPAAVAAYYDRYTDDYEAVGGDVIQSYRPTINDDLLAYLLRIIGLCDGMKVIDAGCGIAGPAAYFASMLALDIEGVTISPLQVERSAHILAAKELIGSVNIRCGDYHLLDQIYEHDSFDAVIFLESLGHSADPNKAIRSAFAVLKPGGFIFIKDFFPRTTSNEQEQRSIADRIANINRNYCYNTLDLVRTIESLRKNGFALESLRKPDFEPDLSYVFAFEKRLGLKTEAKVPSVEWFEIRCRKGNSRS